jgi:hypothetical protein
MKCRLIVAVASTFLVAGCSKADKPADTTAVAPAPAPAPPALSLADVAGKWQVRSVPESGTDTTPTNYVLTATADTTGWMITFPTGLKVPVHVSVSGDSLMVRTGTYTSQRRKGVKVMTEGTSRLQGGRIVGTTIAHYQSGKDSVLHLRFEGTKIP